MTGQTPTQPSAKVRALADDMRDVDNKFAYAIGYIRAGVDSEYVSDAEFRDAVRTVLAALDLARDGA